MRCAFPTALIAMLLLALPGCHGSHDYDLRRGPFLFLVATETDHTKVTLEWNDDAFDGARKLVMERRRVGNNKFRNLEVRPAPADIEYTDSFNLKPGRKYAYRLHGFFSSGEQRSTILRVMVPDAPVPLTRRPRGSDEVPWIGATPGETRLSPEGTRLAFVMEGRLYLRDLLDGVTRQFPGPVGPLTGVAWFPDGRLAITTPDRLFRLDLGTGAARPLSSAGVGGADPDVAPDGLTVVFSRSDGIYATGADEGPIAGLLPAPAAKPRWSPDGSSLAFLAETPVGTEVRIAAFRPDGTTGTPRTLASGAAESGPLVWSQHGDALACPAAGGGWLEVSVGGEK